MSPDTKSLQLTPEEEAALATDLLQVWRGLTGLSVLPTSGAAIDLVQRTLRKARSTIAARSDAQL
jgi:hypothetical protein